MIIDLQRRLSEVGRIRIGQQVASRGKGGKRPEKLDTFRLTSPDRTRIEAAAKLYGGEVKPWEAPSGNQFEVITQTDTLPVVVPPTDMCFSQFYELWSGGGCQRRCNGLAETISDGPCLCDPEKRECSIHTRLSVMLRDLPGLGVWRIDTGSFYAGGELQGAMEIVKLAAGRGQMLPASLRLDQRKIKRANDTVKRFAVPVLDLAISPAQLLGGGDPLDAGTLAVEPPQPGSGAARAADGTIGNLTPVPESVPERPTPSIAEQAAPPAAKKPRKNAAQKIPPTKVKPRTAAEAQADERRQLSAAGVGHSGDGNVSEQTEGPWGAAPPPPDDWVKPDRFRLNRNMHAVFNEANITERDDRLTITRYIAKRHDLKTSNDLSDKEMQVTVDQLNAWKRDEVLQEKMIDILDQAAIDQQNDNEGQLTI